MQLKKWVPVAIFCMAALILALGIYPMTTHFTAWDSVAENALAQGATEEQINEYYDSTYFPDILLPDFLTSAGTTLGFVSLLLTAGFFALGLSRKKAPAGQAWGQEPFDQVQNAAHAGQSPAPDWGAPSDVPEEDDLFDDFETVDKDSEASGQNAGIQPEENSGQPT